MLIGILQSGHFAQREGAPLRDYSTLYAEMLAGHGFRFKTWSVVDMEFPASPEDADGWLISGSKHGVYDDLPFIAPLEDFIRKIYAAGIPLVGICFGHQIMAQALGGLGRKISRRLVGRKRGLRLSRRQQSLLERVASGSSRDTSS